MQPGVGGLFQSYKHGGGQQPLLGRTVRDVRDQALARWPDRAALLVPQQRICWNWHELHRQARELAAGPIFININPAYRPPELEFPLDKVGCRIVRARWHVQARCTDAYDGRPDGTGPGSDSGGSIKWL